MCKNVYLKQLSNAFVVLIHWKSSVVSDISPTTRPFSEKHRNAKHAYIVTELKYTGPF